MYYSFGDFVIMENFTANKTNGDGNWITYIIIPVAILKILFALAAIFGNGLVVLSRIKFKEIGKFNSTILFLTNVSGGDLIMGFIVIPLNTWMNLNEGPHSASLCMIQLGMFFWSMAASVFFLTIAGLDKFVAIHWPYWHERSTTRRNLIIICMTCWIYSFIFAGLPFFGWHVPGVWSKQIHDCLGINVWHPGYIFLCVVHGYCSTIGLIIVYIKIGHTAFKQANEIHALRINFGKDINLKATQKQEKYNKASKTLLLIIGVFTACVIPFTTVGLVQCVHKLSYGYSDPLLDNVMEVMTATLVLNAALNPLIYYKTIPEFRAAFRKILKLN